MSLTIAVVGVGLIGGSFALASKRAGVASRVLGVSSPNTLSKALSLGIVDEALPLEEAVPRADLVFLSSTISGIIETLPRLRDIVRADATVTDAGSTKRTIVNAARNAGAMYFVGGHPMAGKEKGGVEESDADLFENRLWVLTPDSNANDSRLERLKEIVSAVGARPVVMDAREHDAAVARTSHLPQLLSTALAATLEQSFHQETPVLAGPGLLDATRLALSPFTVWRDILETNRDQIVTALDEYLEEWRRQAEALADDGNLEEQFSRAASFARRLRE
ncbi:MAG: prephenate dehydrogenase/arogenate dehydrogenase family protein [Bryobacterales bacterium]|nr:prephenate dehydrogenase/arogenate dehydrogenase family protein [Bryobacterales bacterium]